MKLNALQFEDVAMKMASGNWTDKEIAAELKVGVRALRKAMKDPDFARRVAKERKIIELHKALVDAVDENTGSEVRLSIRRQAHAYLAKLERPQGAMAQSGSRGGSTATNLTSTE